MNKITYIEYWHSTAKELRTEFIELDKIPYILELIYTQGHTVKEVVVDNIQVCKNDNYDYNAEV